MRTCRLGLDQEFRLAEPLDAWPPVVAGNTARVFAGFLGRPDHTLVQYAVKVMRSDKSAIAPPLFREEAQILRLMQDVPGITRLIECGFILLDGGMNLPDGPKPPDTDALPKTPGRTTGYSLKGAVDRFDFSEIDDFMATVDERVARSWLPYLAMERRRPSEQGGREQNLLTLFDEVYARPQVAPVSLGLQVAVEICRILEIAHARGIWYRDHRLWHYIWHQEHKRLYMIDWNRASLVNGGLTDVQRRMDLTLFGACGLYHIFAGHEHPQYAHLQAMFKTLPVQSDDMPGVQRYTRQWAPADLQGLQPELRTLLETLLVGGYTDVAALRKDLQTLLKANAPLY